MKLFSTIIRFIFKDLCLNGLDFSAGRDMIEVKSKTEENPVFFGSMEVGSSQAFFRMKTAKYAENIMGHRMRYGKHKDAHKGAETARVSLTGGTAEPA